MATIKKSGTFQGKSNKLGYGGRAAQMKAHGVPGGVIGAIARKEGAAPGGPNYHGGKKKVPQRDGLRKYAEGMNMRMRGA